MRILQVAVVLVLAVGSDITAAQRAAPVKGPPTISCGLYTEARVNEVGAVGPSSIQIFSWVQGYLSAYNHYAKYPIVEVPEQAAIGRYLDKHCLDNPFHHVANGIDALLAELGGYRQPYLNK